MTRVIIEPAPLDLEIGKVHALIRGRRTVKPQQYDGREIERGHIESILENANWAPTHGNTEPWRFLVYAGKAREELSEILPALYERVTAAQDQKPGKAEKLRSNARLASHVIGLCMKRQQGGKIPEIEEIEAVACAVQNMALTAYALGIGSFWSTGPMIYTGEARSCFGLEGDDLLLGFLYLGYPKVGFPAGSREEVRGKVEWIGEGEGREE